MAGSRLRIVASLILFTLSGATASALPVRGDLALTFDETGGRSVDAEVSVSAGRHVSLRASAGQSTGSEETADLRGTLLGVGASLHGDRAGLSLDYDSFDDSSNYVTSTLAARGWISAGDFEIALLARHREMDVTLTLALPQRTLQRDVNFAALGGGVQISWSRDDFNAYVQALRYDYDDDFDRFMALSASPQLARRPRIEALIGTFLTQAQGAIDRQAGAGVEKAFGRHSLALDLSAVHDAILDADSTSVAVTWRFAQSARVDWSLTAGIVDSDTVGDVGFAGFSVGLGN